MWFKYFFHESLSYVNGFVGGFDNYKVGYLAQIVHHHHNDMLFGCIWESFNEFHRYDFPIPFREWDWLQQSHWVPLFYFDLLEFQALGNVFSDLLLHSRPIIHFINGRYHFLITKMTWIMSLMRLIHYELLQVNYTRHLPSLFEQQHTIVSELVIPAHCSLSFLL